ncbi:MAG: N-acetylmuramoyl-L-alanine amidase [Lachnospiraceae bacterium]|nr:N-acetylmuramoyl-L-alanine amidase [Lachnospiraceae bacterium]
MQQLMKRTVVYAMILSVAIMCMVLVYAGNRQIVITDITQEQGQVKSSMTVADGKKLSFGSAVADSKYLIIPLTETIKAEDVTIENHYMDHELWIEIQGLESGFFPTHEITGDATHVSDGRFTSKNGSFCLKFQLTDIYEYRSILEKNQLYIEFVHPKDMYERIVVIDPSADDVSLEVAEKLRNSLNQTDIRAYFVRQDKTAADVEQTMELVEKTGADLYIKLGVLEHTDTAKYGVVSYYDPDYFIPQFGNQELADLLERNVVTVLREKANGILPCEENSILRKLKIPSADLRLGYMSNRKEAELLQEESYQKLAAEGIMTALQSYYQ